MWLRIGCGFEYRSRRPAGRCVSTWIVVRNIVLDLVKCGNYNAFGVFLNAVNICKTKDVCSYSKLRTGINLSSYTCGRSSNVWKRSSINYFCVLFNVVNLTLRLLYYTIIQLVSNILYYLHNAICRDDNFTVMEEKCI